MLIVWKGGASRITLTDPETVGVIIGVGGAVALVITIFFLPWLWRRLIKNDWELRYYHVFMGPLLLQRPEPRPARENCNVVQNYYRGHKTMEELEAQRAAHSATKAQDVEHMAAVAGQSGNGQNGSGSHDSPDLLGAAALDEKDGTSSPDMTPVVVQERFSIIGPRPGGPLYSPGVLFWQFKRFFFHGVEKDIVSLQGKRNILTGDLELMHAHAAHYNNKAEYMYSFLQVMTAAAASFTHGANDVSK